MRLSASFVFLVAPASALAQQSFYDPVVLPGPAQASALFGAEVESIGDVNGDGYDDLAVGATAMDAPLSNEGVVFVHLGTADGPSPVADWSHAGGQAGGAFGEAIAGGDVNGDGYADLVVTTRNFDGAYGDEGRVQVFLGGPGGLASTPAWTGTGGQTNAQLGYSVATLDVNGDGYDDVVAGAHLFDDGQTDEGQARLWLGGPAGLAAAPAWTTSSNQAQARTGSSVANAGDVNGDGYDDLLVGALRTTVTQTAEGRASLFLGGPSGPSTSPAWTAQSGQANAQLGNAVAGAGDVDGDGYDDVVVGVHNWDGTATNEGQVRVYRGGPSGLASTPAWTRTGGGANRYLGWEVTGGDLDGDGFSDLVLSAPWTSNGHTEEGRVLVFAGSPQGPGLDPIASFEPDEASAYAGIDLAVGDLNGDGALDLAYGAHRADGGATDSGVVFAHLGSPLALQATLPPEALAEIVDLANAAYGPPFPISTNGKPNRIPPLWIAGAVGTIEVHLQVYGCEAREVTWISGAYHRPLGELYGAWGLGWLEGEMDAQNAWYGWLDGGPDFGTGFRAVSPSGRFVSDRADGGFVAGQQFAMNSARGVFVGVTGRCTGVHPADALEPWFGSSLAGWP